MRRIVIGCLLAASPTAVAFEFSSTTEVLELRGQHDVITQGLALPIGDPSILMVTFAASPQSQIALSLDAQSRLTWPDAVRHELRGLPGSGQLRTLADLSFDLSLDVIGLSLINNFTLLSLQFDQARDGFDPFLLPGDAETSASVVVHDNSLGALDESFEIISLPANLASLGFGVYVTPQSTTNVSGNRLLTSFDGDTYLTTASSDVSTLDLYQNTGRVELQTDYQASVYQDMGVAIDLTIELQTILGDFDFSLWSTYFPLFVETKILDFASLQYVHPLPKIASSVNHIDFGTRKVGLSDVYTLPIDNDGEMALEGRVGFAGDPVFTVGPPEIYAQERGQDAIIVTFSPDAPGTFEGVITIESSDPLWPVVEIPVRGVGEEDEIVTSPDNDDDGLYTDGGASTLYAGCGCASGGPAGWPALLLLPFGLRRRSGGRQR